MKYLCTVQTMQKDRRTGHTVCQTETKQGKRDVKTFITRPTELRGVYVHSWYWFLQ